MVLRLNISDALIQRAIKDLENFDFIPPIAKAHILLVANGNKPSTHTELLIDFDIKARELYRTDSDDISKLVEIVTALGLKYKTETHEFMSPLHNVKVSMTIIFVAPSMSTIDQLLDARATGDDEREGLLLGYPVSAAKAFANDELMTTADIPKYTSEISAEEMKFLGHRVSKNNWKNELKYLPEYADVTKRISRKIYRQCLL